MILCIRMLPAAPSKAMLHDAKRFGSLFDGGRLRLARETRGLSQTDLARVMKTVTAPAISQYEQGQIKPSVQNLAEIAKVLDFPVSFFATPHRGSEPAAFFRSLRGASARKKAAARGHAEIASMLVDALERHVELPQHNVPTHLVGPAVQRQAIERIAAQVRAAWGLSDGPIPNVVEELERHGIVVARLPLMASEIDAFSVPFAARPVVVLTSDKGATDRSRFDAAHELGHLVMHREPNADDHAAIERQAHWFAAAFLAPSDELRDELPTHVDWNEIARLKQRWGISMSSLLLRARDLHRIPQATYVRAMKYMSVRGWRRSEPVSLGEPERPTLLAKAVKLLDAEGVDVRTLAENAGLPAKLAEEIVGASADSRPRVEI